MNPLLLRAGGRRRYNTERQRLADERRKAIESYLLDTGVFGMCPPRGVIAAVAKRFGISPATAWRYVNRIIYGPRRTTYHNAETGEVLFVTESDFEHGAIRRIILPDGKTVDRRKHKAFLDSYDLDGRGRKLDPLAVRLRDSLAGLDTELRSA